MKNKIGIGIVLLLVIICLLTIYFKYDNYKKEKSKLDEKILILNTIKNHYNEYAVTNKETKLYKKEQDKYIESGKINSNIKISLDKNDKITIDTKYFYVPDLDLYIYYEDVSPSDEFVKDNRYTKYIYFNNNIITKDITNFYDKDDNLLYTLNKSFDFKVLVKDEDKYGVVFNDELLYIKVEDVEKIYDNDNNQSNKSRVKTLTYHFIYNPSTSQCNEAICFKLDQFDSHLKYLKDNDCFTLKLDELELYLDGKINIPENSIVLTIDDGTNLDQGALRLLEKYDLNATLFVITSWVDSNDFKSPNLDLESHTNNMHNQYECKGYGMQGGGILCLPEEKVLEDLKISQDKVGGSKYFAYPFFDFNDRAIELLKQAGFHMAFIGQYDTDGYSYPNKTDKYKVRRKTIFSDTSMDEFISYLQ